MTVYIAGPITGDPVYHLKFSAVFHRIMKNYPDAIILNPATLPEGMDLADYMAICLPMLMRADFAVLLPGWRKSGGAQIEKELADYLRIRTVEISPEQLREAMEDLRR